MDDEIVRLLTEIRSLLQDMNAAFERRTQETMAKYDQVNASYWRIYKVALPLLLLALLCALALQWLGSH